MSIAQFHFFAELNDFLNFACRNTVFDVSFTGRQSVKHLIEAAGVPHTEVGCIRVNGQFVDLHYLVQDNDQIEVVPASASTNPTRLEKGFVLDNHLGRLASYLRLLGFDVLYQNNYQDDELVRIAAQEERILLSRDRRLLMRKVIQYGYCVRHLEPRQQLTEVIERFGLSDQLKPFNRCLRCNHPLEPVAKEVVLDRLEPLTRLYFEEFHICPACQQIYWKGSHYEHMQALIHSIQPRG
jgi:uncharacterized protein with PIN domain/sulfur carrier protein ThiS